MLSSLLVAAFLMGLAGGPHCLAMCGAACAGVGGVSVRSQASLHLGRVLGYGLLGALLGGVAGSALWLSQQMLWLKPVWLTLQAGILAWGLVLLLFGRQPQFVQQPLNRALGRWRVRARTSPQLLGAGMAWALVPCGLLYSALLLALLSGGPVQGALVMMAFATATVAWLLVAPALWRSVRSFKQNYGLRLAGLALVLASGWALTHAVVEHVDFLCSVAP
jgi:uncharacterized protein